MTGTEKKIVTIALIIFIIWIAIVTFTARSCVDEIEEKGLKGIVTEIWEGENN